MSSCTEWEPMPEAVYAPIFYRSWLAEIGVQWLGEVIVSRYRRYRFHSEEIENLNLAPELKKGLNQSEDCEITKVQVLTGPYCRVYWGNGKPEPHAYESAWRQEGKKWMKPHPNYLSYDVLVCGLQTEFTPKISPIQNIALSA